MRCSLLPEPYTSNYAPPEPPELFWPTIPEPQGRILLNLSHRSYCILLYLSNSSCCILVLSHRSSFMQPPEPQKMFYPT